MASLLHLACRVILPDCQTIWQSIYSRAGQGFKTGGWVVRVLDSADVGRLLSTAEAIAAVQEAFAGADRGGAPRMLIADGGLLTELRTAAAGAVAADLLARPGARSAAVIGTGGQARYQLLALLQVRPIEQMTVWGRRRQAAEQYQRDMATGVPVGSDMPHEQELDPRILVAVGKYVPDSIDAAADSGELHHALEAGPLEAGSVYGELTAVASGRLAGRTADDELTVADLTGLGIQDAAVAVLATRLADEHGAGRDVPLGDW